MMDKNGDCEHCGRDYPDWCCDKWLEDFKIEERNRIADAIELGMAKEQRTPFTALRYLASLPERLRKGEV
jgi:hypothetical protein